MQMRLHNVIYEGIEILIWKKGVAGRSHPLIKEKNSIFYQLSVVLLVFVERKKNGILDYRFYTCTIDIKAIIYA